jgi:hypothetical protein
VPAKKRRAPRTSVAKIMRKQGRTYVWLADVTGYSKTHVNAMANKRAPMNPRFIKLAAQALGVPEAAVTR